MLQNPAAFSVCFLSHQVTEGEMKTAEKKKLHQGHNGPLSKILNQLVLGSPLLKCDPAPSLQAVINTFIISN